MLLSVEHENKFTDDVIDAGIYILSGSLRKGLKESAIVLSKAAGMDLKEIYGDIKKFRGYLSNLKNFWNIGEKLYTYVDSYWRKQGGSGSFPRNIMDIDWPDYLGEKLANCYHKDFIYIFTKGSKYKLGLTDLDIKRKNNYDKPLMGLQRFNNALGKYLDLEYCPSCFRSIPNIDKMMSNPKDVDLIEDMLNKYAFLYGINYNDFKDYVRHLDDYYLNIDIALMVLQEGLKKCSKSETVEYFTAVFQTAIYLLSYPELKIHNSEGNLEKREKYPEKEFALCSIGIIMP